MSTADDLGGLQPTQKRPFIHQPARFLDQQWAYDPSSHHPIVFRSHSQRWICTEMLPESPHPSRCCPLIWSQPDCGTLFIILHSFRLMWLQVWWWLRWNRPTGRTSEWRSSRVWTRRRIRICFIGWPFSQLLLASTASCAFHWASHKTLFYLLKVFHFIARCSLLVARFITRSKPVVDFPFIVSCSCWLVRHLIIGFDLLMILFRLFVRICR